MVSAFACGSAYAVEARQPFLKDFYMPKKGIEVGPFIVHSSFRFEEMYDTNVYLQTTDEKGDFMTRLNPYLSVEIPIKGKHLLFVSYDMDVNVFGKYDDQNSINHTLRGLEKIEFADCEFTFEEVYRHFSDRAGSEDTGRIKRWNNRMKTNIKREFGRLGMDLGYDFRIEKYCSEDRLIDLINYKDKDRLEHTFTGELSYDYTSRASLVTEADLGFITFDSREFSDAYFIDTFVGLKGEILRHLFADLRVGFRHYDLVRQKRDDYDNAVVKGWLSKELSPDDILTAELLKTTEISTYHDMDYFERNRIGLNYRHRFPWQIFLNIFGSYDFHYYPEKTTEGGLTQNRYDNIYAGGCGLQYNLGKYFTFEAQYKYLQKKSNFHTFDYVDHVIMVGGKASF